MQSQGFNLKCTFVALDLTNNTGSALCLHTFFFHKVTISRGRDFWENHYGIKRRLQTVHKPSTRGAFGSSKLLNFS